MERLTIILNYSLELSIEVHRKGFNSLCILGAWTLWKHRNACAFDGMTPNLQRALQDFKDESLLWRFAGAKGLAALNPGRVIEQV